VGRPSNQFQRKKQIVDALLAVMATTGYENASINAIAKHAGLASGLVHYHFKNKQAILVELVNLLDDTAQSRYQDLKLNASDPKQKLSAFIDSALALGQGSNQHAVAAWVMIGAESIRQEEVREIYQTVVKKNLSELQLLIRNYSKENDKKLTKKTIENIATIVYGSIEGSYQLASTASEIIPKNYAAKALKNMLFALLDAGTDVII